MAFVLSLLALAASPSPATAGGAVPVGAGGGLSLLEILLAALTVLLLVLYIGYRVSSRPAKDGDDEERYRAPMPHTPDDGEDPRKREIYRAQPRPVAGSPVDEAQAEPIPEPVAPPAPAAPPPPAYPEAPLTAWASSPAPLMIDPIPPPAPRPDTLLPVTPPPAPPPDPQPAPQSMPPQANPFAFPSTQPADPPAAEITATDPVGPEPSASGLNAFELPASVVETPDAAPPPSQPTSPPPIAPPFPTEPMPPPQVAAPDDPVALPVVPAPIPIPAVPVPPPVTASVPVPAASAAPPAAPSLTPAPGAGAVSAVPLVVAPVPAGGQEAALILLIEDDERIAKFYTILFQAKGFRVENAHDGVEGVDMAQALKPALILLDVMMPKMNGLMVLQILRANPETEKTPVVVLSNYMEPPLIQRALQLGAIEYVVKSQARPEQLVNALPSWLKGEPAIH